MATSSDTSDLNNVKSRRPAESAFKQQRLPAWQPILTAGTVLPTFFVIGIAFIPVGIGLLYFSDEVKELKVDYTHCEKKGDTISCSDYIKQLQAQQASNSTTGTPLDPVCICEKKVNLTEDFKAEVYFYYGLSNYYQNHRRYVKSRDDNQLLGRLEQPPSTDCDPFSYAYDENNVRKPVAPCGAIANSLFNDTLRLYSVEPYVEVPVLRTGIAWTSDKDIKFRNPDTSAYNGSLKAAFANYTKPANWAKHVWELDPEDPTNNGFQNEDLIVWMRTAALPTFRKLYRRVNHEKDGFRTGLNKGRYLLQIEYRYPVTEFDGTKSFIISTTSLLGGKNPFLGVAYVVVGTLCLLLGIILLIIHVRCSKSRLTSSAEAFFLDHDSMLALANYKRESMGDRLPVIVPTPSLHHDPPADNANLEPEKSDSFIYKPDRTRSLRFKESLRMLPNEDDERIDQPQTSQSTSKQTLGGKLTHKKSNLSLRDGSPDKRHRNLTIVEPTLDEHNNTEYEPVYEIKLPAASRSQLTRMKQYRQSMVTAPSRSELVEAKLEVESGASTISFQEGTSRSPNRYKGLNRSELVEALKYHRHIPEDIDEVDEPKESASVDSAVARTEHGDSVQEDRSIEHFDPRQVDELIEIMKMEFGGNDTDADSKRVSDPDKSELTELLAEKEEPLTDKKESKESKKEKKDKKESKKSKKDEDKLHSMHDIDSAVTKPQRVKDVVESETTIDPSILAIGKENQHMKRTELIEAKKRKKSKLYEAIAEEKAVDVDSAVVHQRDTIVLDDSINFDEFLLRNRKEDKHDEEVDSAISRRTSRRPSMNYPDDNTDVVTAPYTIEKEAKSSKNNETQKRKSVKYTEDNPVVDIDTSEKQSEQKGDTKAKEYNKNNKGEAKIETYNDEKGEIKTSNEATSSKYVDENNDKRMNKNKKGKPSDENNENDKYDKGGKDEANNKKHEK